MYRKEEYSTLVRTFRLLTKKRESRKIRTTSKQQHHNIAHLGYFKGTSVSKEIRTPHRTHDSRLPVKYFMFHAMPQSVKKDIVIRISS